MKKSRNINSKTNAIIPIDKTILQIILLCLVVILIAKLSLNLIIIGFLCWFFFGNKK